MSRHRPVDARFDFRPAIVGGQLAHPFHDFASLGFRYRGHVGAAHRRGRDLDARAHVQAQGDRARAAHHIDVQHGQPVARAQAHHALAEFGQFLHARMREFADVQARQHGAAQAQGGDAQAVLGAVLDIHQVAELGQRVASGARRWTSADRRRVPDPDCRACDRRGESRPGPPGRAPNAFTKWRSALAAAVTAEMFGFLVSIIDNP